VTVEAVRYIGGNECTPIADGSDCRHDDIDVAHMCSLMFGVIVRMCVGPKSILSDSIAQSPQSANQSPIHSRVHVANISRQRTRDTDHQTGLHIILDTTLTHKKLKTHFFDHPNPNPMQPTIHVRT
jgi:hypothetical protein